MTSVSGCMPQPGAHDPPHTVGQSTSLLRCAWIITTIDDALPCNYSRENLWAPRDGRATIVFYCSVGLKVSIRTRQSFREFNLNHFLGRQRRPSFHLSCRGLSSPRLSTSLERGTSPRRGERTLFSLPFRCGSLSQLPVCVIHVRERASARRNFLAFSTRKRWSEMSKVRRYSIICSLLASFSVLGRSVRNRAASHRLS